MSQDENEENNQNIQNDNQNANENPQNPPGGENQMRMMYFLSIYQPIIHI